MKPFEADKVEAMAHEMASLLEGHPKAVAREALLQVQERLRAEDAAKAEPTSEELNAREQIKKALSPLSKPEQATVLRAVRQKLDGKPYPETPEELAAEKAVLSEEIESLLSQKKARTAEMDRLLADAGLTETVRNIERRARLLTLPPATSPTNIETLAMGLGYMLPPPDAGIEPAVIWTIAAARSEFVQSVSKKLLMFLPEEQPASEPSGTMVLFANRWARSGFARLEVGHKLAASLCLTDVPPDVEVKAPWDAWSLVVPDGLLADGAAEISRIWCVGCEPWVLIAHVDGDLRVLPWSMRNGDDSVTNAALGLIRGACLALSNPDDFRKENQHGPTARASHKSNRHGPPDLQQARFLLSAPVKVDLREHLRGVLSGRKGASPTVQFLVRGHWRNQAHGPKASLRKTIWIQPFWKGPEESRILLRQHRIEEPTP